MNYNNQIIQGDCLRVLPQLPLESVDLVLTDPPYLVNYHSRDGRSIAGDKSSDWLRPAFAEISRVLKPGRLCVSFYGWNKADEFLSAWRAAGLRPVAHLVWVKGYASSIRLVKRQHEQAYVLAKGEPRWMKSLSDPPPDVLKWHYTGNKLHPTQKPVTSLLSPILTFSNPGELVLDPFCGSGSTLMAAKLSGRRYIGIELDAHYCAEARKRLAKA